MTRRASKGIIRQSFASDNISKEEKGARKKEINIKRQAQKRRVVIEKRAIINDSFTDKIGYVSLSDSVSPLSNQSKKFLTVATAAPLP